MNNIGRRLLTAILVLGIVPACGGFARSDGAPPPEESTLAAVVARSPIIVVASIASQGGTRNVAKDSEDITKEHPVAVVLVQDYVLSVEEVLKGALSSGSAIAIVKARGTKVAVSDAHDFIPFKVGGRYVLFLRPIPEDRIVVPAGEPGRFAVRDSQVSPESMSPQVIANFPTESLNTFLQKVRELAGALR